MKHTHLLIEANLQHIHDRCVVSEHEKLFSNFFISIFEILADNVLGYSIRFGNSLNTRVNTTERLV